MCVHQRDDGRVCGGRGRKRDLRSTHIGELCVCMCVVCVHVCVCVCACV